MKDTIFSRLLVLVVLLFFFNVHLIAEGRLVHLVYSFEKNSFTHSIDLYRFPLTHTIDSNGNVIFAKETYNGNPYTFKFNKDDQGVIWVFCSDAELKNIKITYSIQYPSNDVDYNSLFGITKKGGEKTLTSNGTRKQSNPSGERQDKVGQQDSGGKITSAEHESMPIIDTDRGYDLEISEPLPAGGKLIVTITKSYGEKEPEIIKQLTYLIEGDGSFIFQSVGLVFSKASYHNVQILNTTEKIENSEDKYWQVVSIKDRNDGFDPIQSAVTFTNFQLYKILYLSFGIPLNKSLFQEPLIGLSIYLEDIKLSVTGGIHFNKEIKIDSSSGFYEGMKIDPSLGITNDKIPTREEYKKSFFLGLSFVL